MTALQMRSHIYPPIPSYHLYQVKFCYCSETELDSNESDESLAQLIHQTFSESCSPDIYNIMDGDSQHEDILPPAYSIYYPSMLGHIQELLKCSETHTDYSHLDPKIIMTLTPKRYLNPSWLKKYGNNKKIDYS